MKAQSIKTASYPEEYYTKDAEVAGPVALSLLAFLLALPLACCTVIRLGLVKGFEVALCGIRRILTWSLLGFFCIIACLFVALYLVAVFVSMNPNFQ